MAQQVRILAFSGSTRDGSYNTMLVKAASAGATRLGAQVTVLNLRDLALPMYDEDLEKREGLPAGVRRFKDALRAAHGVLIASPEYNSSISAALKNAIDWASRPENDQPPLSCFNGKVAGLLAASPGALGGLRGLVHLRSILGNIGVIVLPQQFALSKSHEAFAPDGSIKDEKTRAAAEGIAEAVASTCAKLAG
ncbi:MAG: NAD(P)H-dependent oxidoreductase [Planctomycetota bacterium]|nr:NAD(P)H-dependent oxidoreductase [Planctomycetota bacterium]